MRWVLPVCSIPFITLRTVQNIADLPGNDAQVELDQNRVGGIASDSVDVVRKFQEKRAGRAIALDAPLINGDSRPVSRIDDFVESTAIAAQQPHPAFPGKRRDVWLKWKGSRRGGRASASASTNASHGKEEK